LPGEVAVGEPEADGNRSCCNFRIEEHGHERKKERGEGMALCCTSRDFCAKEVEVLDLSVRSRSSGAEQHFQIFRICSFAPDTSPYL
jgi:hypothetical protein